MLCIKHEELNLADFSVVIFDTISLFNGPKSLIYLEINIKSLMYSKYVA